MSAEPKVLGPTELDNAGAVGETIQVAIVTDDLKNALDHLITLGIGPWMVMSLGPHNSDMKYKGEKSDISMKVAFTNHGSMMWEVIQPTGGKSIYQDFLDEGRQGFHHVGIDGGGQSLRRAGGRPEGPRLRGNPGRDRVQRQRPVRLLPQRRRRLATGRDLRIPGGFRAGARRVVPGPAARRLSTAIRRGAPWH